MIVVRKQVILVPVVVFKTPRQPFHQQLHVGYHVGNVELVLPITIPRPPFIVPEIGTIKMLARAHDIWLGLKQNPSSCEEDDEIKQMLACSMSENDLSDLMGSKRKWALRCLGNIDPNCECAHCAKDHSIVCRCFESIVHTNHFDDFSTAIAKVGRFIFETMEACTIANHFGDNSTPKITFNYKGEEKIALMMSGSNFLMFSAMEEYTRECLDLCQQLRNWSAFINMDNNYSKFQ